MFDGDRGVKIEAETSLVGLKAEIDVFEIHEVAFI